MSLKIMDSLLINKSNVDLFAICFVRDKSCLMILDAHIMESQQDSQRVHSELKILPLTHNFPILTTIFPNSHHILEICGQWVIFFCFECTLYLDKLVLHHSLYYFYGIARVIICRGVNHINGGKGFKKVPKTCMLNQCPLYYSKHSLPHDFLFSL